jgi:hypothetical protein
MSLSRRDTASGRCEGAFSATEMLRYAQHDIILLRFYYPQRLFFLKESFHTECEKYFTSFILRAERKTEQSEVCRRSAHNLKTLICPGKRASTTLAKNTPSAQREGSGKIRKFVLYFAFTAKFR